MAFIEIYVTPNGNAACGGYFYSDDKKIKPGEVAWVPDSDLETHIERGFVHQTTLAKAEGRIVNEEDRPRPGRKPNEDKPGP